MENISTLNSHSSLQLSKTIQDFALACRFRCGIGKGHVLYDAHDEWFCIGGCGRNQSKL